MQFAIHRPTIYAGAKKRWGGDGAIAWQDKKEKIRAMRQIFGHFTPNFYRLNDKTVPFETICGADDRT